MKKIYIALAVFAAATLSSCVHEKSFENLTPLGENDIAFVLQSAATKAGDLSRGSATGVTIPVGKAVNGETFCFEETIEELNPNPATKGAPAYTINVGTLYPNMGVYATEGNFGGAADFSVMDMYEHIGDPSDPTIASGNGWRYKHNYSGRPWPDSDDTPVNFYLNMPAAPTGVNITKRALVDDKPTIEFSYTSPATGEAQQDILFSQTTISKSEHDSFLPNGAPVLMYHALSGVKFRTGWENDNDCKTIITGVKLKGLKSKGTCTYTFDPTTGNVTSSWSVDSDTLHFKQRFTDQAWSATAGDDGTVGDTDHPWNSALVGTSWTSAASDKNLNYADGSLTFWFIPQEIDDNVTMEVTFRVKTQITPNAIEITHTINFGEQLNKKPDGTPRSQKAQWEAGQLRTYTLQPYDVDVEIFDSMTASEKSALKVANTGNVDEYVRLLIMGNWYGWKPGTTEEQMQTTEPSILIGYQYPSKEAAVAAGKPNDPMVEPWYREGQDTDGDGNLDGDIYGSFDSTFALAHLGDRDGKRNDWADASGGFYYTMPIGPGAGAKGAPGNPVASATKNLFDSYTVTNVPTIYLPSGNGRAPAEGVHLVMEIVVQAIAVPKNDDGANKWWLQAWFEATRISKLDPDADRNSRYKTFYNEGEYNIENTGD